jgi:hypothetical protein
LFKSFITALTYGIYGVLAIAALALIFSLVSGKLAGL